jgi:hypothetical protein
MDCSLLNVTDYAIAPRQHRPGQLETKRLNKPALTPRGGVLQVIRFPGSVVMSVCIESIVLSCLADHNHSLVQTDVSGGITVITCSEWIAPC